MTTIHPLLQTVSLVELERVSGGAKRRAPQDKDYQFGWSVSQVGGVFGGTGKTVGGQNQMELGGSSMSGKQQWNLRVNGPSAK